MLRGEGTAEKSPQALSPQQESRGDWKLLHSLFAQEREEMQ